MDEYPIGGGEDTGELPIKKGGYNLDDLDM